MKKTLIPILSILLFACHNNKLSNITIELKDFTNPDVFYSNYVDNIEIIKLDDTILIADRPTLVSDDSSYYIFNRRESPESAKTKENVLLKFDKSGKFQYCIGDNGRGPNEYLFVKNFQILNDTIYIYANQNLIYKFLKSGEFVSKQSIKNKDYSFIQAFKFKNKYFTYRWNDTMSYLVNLNDLEGNIIKTYFYRRPKARPFYITDNFFIPYKDEVLIRDFYSDTIYSINSGNEIKPHIIMDYKIKSDPKIEFMKTEHHDNDLSILGRSTFYVISRYYENEKYIFTGIDHYFVYPNWDYYFVLKDKRSDKYFWFNFKDDKYLKTNLRHMDDSCIYFMTTPNQLDSVSTAFRSKLRNKEILDNLDPYGNSMIIKVHLK